ncbi:hypothetical protein AQUCO_07000022v1 [Aquilegia coerulea]|uniref:Uncharacterized protein n=1 Tax=Aquilegia coerulea TaxID=218851 RepID=A0A2G5CAV7_AQUCA|nr:hypothetical protein AQUCO_07000022v1 [Aquilegia coerulea]
MGDPTNVLDLAWEVGKQLIIEEVKVVPPLDMKGDPSNVLNLALEAEKQLIIEEVQVVPPPNMKEHVVCYSYKERTLRFNAKVV